MKDDRRAFLRTVGGVSAGLAGATALGARAEASPQATARGEGGGLQAAATRPGFTAAYFVLELDGTLTGMLRGFSGGHASSDVVQEEFGSECVVRKALGKVHYADLVLSLVGIPGPELQDWIVEMISCGAGARSGAILSLDANFKELRRLEFKNALLTEVSLPPFDTSAGKAPVVFTLRCQPESTHRAKSSGEKVKVPVSKAKTLLTSNFRFQIKDPDGTKVVRVEGLKVTRNLLPAESEGKAFSIPGKVDVGNLTLDIIESGADTWADWHQSFVIEGKSGSETERAGTLELLAPDLKSVLLAVELRGLGIYDLESPSFEAGAEKSSRVVARLYCEELGFKF